MSKPAVCCTYGQVIKNYINDRNGATIGGRIEDYSETGVTRQSMVSDSERRSIVKYRMTTNGADDNKIIKGDTMSSRTVTLNDIQAIERSAHEAEVSQGEDEIPKTRSQTDIEDMSNNDKKKLAHCYIELPMKPTYQLWFEENEIFCNASDDKLIFRLIRHTDVLNGYFSAKPYKNSDASYKTYAISKECIKFDPKNKE